MFIVPGRATATGLTWWFYSMNDLVPTFEARSGTAIQGATQCRVLSGRRKDLYIVGTTGLLPDTTYELVATTGTNVVKRKVRTLPDATFTEPFTFAFGSCFFNRNYRERVYEHCYPPPAHEDGSQDPIRLRFHLGDQVYMDIASDGMPEVNIPDPWEVHHEQWRTLGYQDFLVRHPNVMVADDHEFWNDYPHSHLLLTWAHRARPTEFDNAFQAYQAALNIDPQAVAAPDENAFERILKDEARTFALDDLPLPLFVLDTRTNRTKVDQAPSRFSRPEWRDLLVKWLSKQTGPCGIMLGSSMFDEPEELGNHGLAAYPEDYWPLCDAIAACKHDVVLFIGDIHRCHVLEVKVPYRTPGRKTIEVASSALAKIPSNPFERTGLSKPGYTPLSGQGRWKTGTARYDRKAYFVADNIYATATIKRLAGGSVSLEVVFWAPYLGVASAAEKYSVTLS